MLTFAALSAVLCVAPLDVTGCKASTQEVGSLHANTAFEVSMTPPKSKHKQPLECGGKAVTLFVSEFASAGGAAEAANFTGPQLWGQSGPSAEHSDELLLQGAVLVIASGPGVGTATEALVKKGFKPWRAPQVDVLERVASALDCKATSRDPLRAWCAATLTTDAGFRPPMDKLVVLGISAPLPSSRDVREVLLKATRVSALSFSGGKVRLTDVTPDNADEERQLLEVAGQVALALKGQGQKVVITPGLASYLPVLVEDTGKLGAAVKEAAKAPAHFKIKNPTRIWTVKSGKLEVYVVSEDTADGAWLSVYPVVPNVTK